MKTILSSITLSLFLISCQPEGRVYIEHQELSPDVEWFKKDSRTFQVPITSTEKAYNLSLSFRFSTGYQYKNASVKMTEISPSGVETIKEYDLVLRADNGDYIGDPGYDIWDSEHLVEAKHKYTETGTYTYILEQNTSVDPLPFVMEIGVILDEVK